MLSSFLDRDANADAPSSKTAKDLLKDKAISAVIRLIDKATESTALEALSAPDEVSTLIGFLSSPEASGILAGETRDPLAAASARGVAQRKLLLEAEGGTASGQELADVLGISRQAIDKRRRAGALLAIPSGSGDWRYPRWQLLDHRPLPGFDKVMKAFGSRGPWTRLGFLLSPNEKTEWRKTTGCTSPRRYRRCRPSDRNTGRAGRSVTLTVVEPLPNLEGKKVPVVDIAAGTTIYRSHGLAHGPLYFGKRRLHRFDDPLACYGVLYAARDPVGAFVETFLRFPANVLLDRSDLDGSGCADIRVKRDLKVVSTSQPPTWSRLALRQKLPMVPLQPMHCRDNGVGQFINLMQHSTASSIDLGTMIVCFVCLALFERASDAFQIKKIASSSWTADSARLGNILDKYNVSIL